MPRGAAGEPVDQLELLQEAARQARQAKLQSREEAEIEAGRMGSSEANPQLPGLSKAPPVIATVSPSQKGTRRSAFIGMRKLKVPVPSATLPLLSAAPLPPAELLSQGSSSSSPLSSSSSHLNGLSSSSSTGKLNVLTSSSSSDPAGNTLPSSSSTSQLNTLSSAPSFLSTSVATSTTSTWLSGENRYTILLKRLDAFAEEKRRPDDGWLTEVEGILEKLSRTESEAARRRERLVSVLERFSAAERAYVDDLFAVLSEYKTPLEGLRIVPKDTSELLFCGIPAIHEEHCHVLRDLERLRLQVQMPPEEREEHGVQEQGTEEKGLGLVLAGLERCLLLYPEYLQSCHVAHRMVLMLDIEPLFRQFCSQVSNTTTMRRRSRSVRFSETPAFMHLSSASSTLSELLLIPSQQLPRYSLLLAQLSQLAAPAGLPALHRVSAAVVEMIALSVATPDPLKQLLSVQERISQGHAQLRLRKAGLHNLLAVPDRSYVFEGDLLWLRRRSSQRTKSTWMHFRCFLLSDTLIACFVKSSFLKLKCSFPLRHLDLPSQSSSSASSSSFSSSSSSLIAASAPLPVSDGWHTQLLCLAFHEPDEPFRQRLMHFATRSAAELLQWRHYLHEHITAVRARPITSEERIRNKEQLLANDRSWAG